MVFSISFWVNVYLSQSNALLQTHRDVDMKYQYLRLSRLYLNAAFLDIIYLNCR